MSKADVIEIEGVVVEKLPNPCSSAVLSNRERLMSGEC